MPFHKCTNSKGHLKAPGTGTEWRRVWLFVCAAGADLLFDDINVIN